MVIDNVVALVESFNTSPFFVTLISIANGLGRIIACFGSDIFSELFSKSQLISSVSFLRLVE